MVERVRGPNGEYGLWTPTEGVRIVSQEEWEQTGMTGPQRAVGAFGDALQDTAGFVMEAVGRGLDVTGEAHRRGFNPLIETGQRLQAANEARQEARRTVDPVANLVGNVAEVAVPLTPPAAQGARVARAAQAGRRGTRLGVNAAETAIKTVDGRAASVAEDLRGVTGPPGRSGARNIQEGTLFSRAVGRTVGRDAVPHEAAVRQADEVGIRLTPGQRMGSDTVQLMEEGAQRNPGAFEAFNRNFGNPNQDTIVGHVRRALGLEDGTRFSWEDMAQAEAMNAQRFDDIIQDMGAGRYQLRDADVAALKDRARAGAGGDQGAYETARRRFIDPAERALDEGDRAARQMDANTMWNHIRALDNAIYDAAEQNTREALQGIRDYWWDRMLNMAKEQSPELERKIIDANQRHRLLTVVQRSGVMDQGSLSVRRTAGGAARVFDREMRTNTFETVAGQPYPDDVQTALKSLNVVKAFPNVLPNSGTPTGTFMTQPGALRKAMASRVGAEAYFAGTGSGLQSAVVNPYSLGVAGVGGFNLLGD